MGIVGYIEHEEYNVDDFGLDSNGTGFLDFTFGYEGCWDDVSMGLVEPVVGEPDDFEAGPQGLDSGPGSSAQ